MQTEKLIDKLDINEEEPVKGSSSADIDESVIKVSEETENDDVIVEESEETENDDSIVEESEETENDDVIVEESKETENNINNSSSVGGTYSSDILDADYTELIAEQRITNELLYRINEQNDLIISIGVTLVICCVAYAILEKFCRF